MLEIVIIPMSKVNSLLKHLEKFVTAFVGECIACKNVSYCL